MNTEMRVKILENAYIGVLADSVLNFTKQGVLDKVVEDKRKIQMQTGKERAAQYGITKPEEVFETSSSVFNCVKWEIESCEDGFEVSAKSCKLCALAKKMGTGNPCYIYCLNPLEGMVKGIAPNLSFIVNETLWSGQKCNIRVTK